MLTRANLGYIRDPHESISDRAKEWRTACEVGMLHTDAESVVVFLQSTPDAPQPFQIVAREINKYLDRVATVLEVKEALFAKRTGRS